VLTTTQSLDYAVGAGRMNLDATFQTQVRGQSGVDGTSTGLQGPVQELGWDFGRALNGLSNDYLLTDPLVGNSTFTTTLSWHRAREWNPDNGLLYETAQANLNLSLWRLGGDNAFETLVAQSASLYNTVEHLSIAIPEEGLYGLRVSYDGNTFANFADWGSVLFPQSYGLAWNGEAINTLHWLHGALGEWNGVDPVWTTSSNGTGGTARSATSPYSTLVLDAPGSRTIVVAGARQAAGLVLNNGTHTFSGSASPSLTIGAGGIHLSSTADGPTTLAGSLPIMLETTQRWTNASMQNLIIEGAVSGPGDLEIEATSGGAVVLNGNHSRAGNTTIVEGRVLVNGDLSQSATTRVESGGSLSGSGRVGNLILLSGGTLAPGNSPGTLHVDGNSTWFGGGQYDWEVHLANPEAGNQSLAGTGWDFMDISGTLTLSGLTSGSRFNLHLGTLSDGTNPGELPSWDPAVGSTWLIASADAGIYLNSGLVSANTNYSSLFQINAVNWFGSVPSSFHVVTLGNTTDLYLHAIGSAAVPEPSQIAASLMLLAGIGIYFLKKHRRVAKAGANMCGQTQPAHQRMD
jgi:hypothetical protein